MTLHSPSPRDDSLAITAASFILADIHTISDVGCPLNRNSAIDICMNNGEWPNETSVELTGSLVVQDEAFITRLVVMLMTFVASSS
jgi:hypothetical protein